MLLLRFQASGVPRTVSRAALEPPRVWAAAFECAHRALCFAVAGDAVLRRRRLAWWTGTIYTALDHGLPLVNLPVGSDQFSNAQRCVAMGVGLTIDPDRRTPEAIRATLREVLACGAFREQARRVERAMRTLPTPDAIVPLLRRLAADKRMLLAGAGEP
jgi:UDP-glucoronosyl and UDP-glucosyl transferase